MPLFARFARWVERQVGRSSTFLLAIAVVVLWGASGPIFGWSDTWQLVINTATTIVTFLMVFVIQNTQTRDTQAMQLKLDELIRSIRRLVTPSLISKKFRSRCRANEGGLYSARHDRTSCKKHGRGACFGEIGRLKAAAFCQSHESIPAPVARTDRAETALKRKGVRRRRTR